MNYWKKIWHDPVGSKLIAAVILSFIASTKIEPWKLLLVGLGFLVIYGMIRSRTPGGRE